MQKKLARTCVGTIRKIFAKIEKNARKGSIRRKL